MRVLETIKPVFSYLQEKDLFLLLNNIYIYIHLHLTNV